MNKSNIPAALLLLFVITGCSKGSSSVSPEPTPPPTPTVKKIPISLTCGIQSRATETGFDTNDKIGLFVVNYSNGSAAALQLTGNHVDNMKFTYNGTWTPDQTIYWKDEATKADFYVYYPYSVLSSLNAQSFTVKEDQSTLDNYKASELLWGKASGIAPTETAVSITTNHVLSTAVVKLAAGNGFTTESLAAAKVSVKLNNLKVGVTFDLTTGTATATGDAKSVVPYKDTDAYRAIVVPQVLTENNLITVNVDGRDYNLKKAFTFEAGKRYTFTITVSKTSEGINVNISSWTDDGKDNGGTAE